MPHTHHTHQAHQVHQAPHAPGAPGAPGTTRTRCTRRCCITGPCASTPCTPSRAYSASISANTSQRVASRAFRCSSCARLHKTSRTAYVGIDRHTNTSASVAASQCMALASPQVYFPGRRAGDMREGSVCSCGAPVPPAAHPPGRIMLGCSVQHVACMPCAACALPCKGAAHSLHPMCSLPLM